MDLLFPRLSHWAADNLPGYDAQFSQDAMRASSAKASALNVPWNCARARSEWTRPTDGQAEILNGRWESSSQPNSRFGRRAPKGSKLRLFGASPRRQWERIRTFQEARSPSTDPQCGLGVIATHSDFSRAYSCPALLSVQRALVGEIPPNIRCIAVKVCPSAYMSWSGLMACSRQRTSMSSMPAP